jgi:FK506-binding protein 4/5
LELDSNNIKALYRRGVAYTETDQWDLAKQDLQRALELDPNNAEVKSAFAKLKKKIRLQDQKDKKIFSNLFDRLRKIEEQEKGTEATSATTSTTTSTTTSSSSSSFDAKIPEKSSSNTTENKSTN